MGTPETASDAIREAAQALSSGDGSVEELRSTLLSNLDDLCRDRPLHGDHLRLFEALERWETSVGADRNQAEDNVTTLAERLAAE